MAEVRAGLGERSLAIDLKLPDEKLRRKYIRLWRIARDVAESEDNLHGATEKLRQFFRKEMKRCAELESNSQ